MNQRDQELLDQQLRGFSRSPPRNGGIMGVGFIAVFLVGIAIGDVLLRAQANEYKPHRMT